VNFVSIGQNLIQTQSQFVVRYEPSSSLYRLLQVSNKNN